MGIAPSEDSTLEAKREGSVSFASTATTGVLCQRRRGWGTRMTRKTNWSCYILGRPGEGPFDLGGVEGGAGDAVLQLNLGQDFWMEIYGQYFQSVIQISAKYIVCHIVPYYSAQYNCPWEKSRIISLGSRDISFGPRNKTWFSLCTIPTVGFYEKHGEITSQILSIISLEPPPPLHLWCGARQCGSKLLICYPLKSFLR
jgi:hypothetical protein